MVVYLRNEVITQKISKAMPHGPCENHNNHHLSVVFRTIPQIKSSSDFWLFVVFASLDLRLVSIPGVLEMKNCPKPFKTLCKLFLIRSQIRIKITNESSARNCRQNICLQINLKFLEYESFIRGKLALI